MNTPPAVEYMVQHVLTHLNKRRTPISSGQNIPPLVVGVQGPQGSGKTFLTTHLRDVLMAEPHKLAITVLSIDDLYLPHHELVKVATSNPHNALLSGRGQPGTHDVPLGTNVLHGLRRINNSGAQDVVLPVFDKSLHGGEGDRITDGLHVKGPIDVVIVEGWCTGFYPISLEEIDKRWSQPVKGLEGAFSLDMYRKEDIVDINEKLRDYAGWWSLFDIFIQIKPVDTSPYIFIYKWRLQQEHNMKARNGGKGMTDDQVTSFVNRYIPGYVFFGDGVEHGYLASDGLWRLPPWHGNGLRITVGEQRDVIGCTSF